MTVSTMRHVRLLATLRDLAGTKQIEVPIHEGETVRSFLDKVAQLHPKLGAAIRDEQGELTGLVHILIDGRNIQWLSGLDTPIRASAEVILLPPTAGG